MYFEATMINTGIHKKEFPNEKFKMIEIDKQEITEDKGKILRPLKIPENSISRNAPNPKIMRICSGLRLNPSKVSPKIKYKNNSPPNTQRVSFMEGVL
jgi:hypothetical protein